MNAFIFKSLSILFTNTFYIFKILKILFKLKINKTKTMLFLKKTTRLSDKYNNN